MKVGFSKSFFFVVVKNGTLTNVDGLGKSAFYSLEKSLDLGHSNQVLIASGVETWNGKACRRLTVNLVRELSRVLILVRLHCACAHGFVHVFVHPMMPSRFRKGVFSWDICDSRANKLGFQPI